MHSFSEFVVTLTIWGLLLVGLFFGLRAALRKRKRRDKDD